MATIVKRNNRSQDAIRKNLGLSTGSSGPGANTVYKQSQTPVRATSGGLSAPKGWYNESSGPGLSGIKNAVTGLKTNIGGALGNTMPNVKKTVNDYKGISSSTSLSTIALYGTAKISIRVSISSTPGSELLTWYILIC